MCGRPRRSRSTRRNSRARSPTPRSACMMWHAAGPKWTWSTPTGSDQDPRKRLQAEHRDHSDRTTRRRSAPRLVGDIANVGAKQGAAPAPLASLACGSPAGARVGARGALDHPPNIKADPPNMAATGGSSTTHDAHADVDLGRVPPQTSGVRAGQGGPMEDNELGRKRATKSSRICRPPSTTRCSPQLGGARAGRMATASGHDSPPPPWTN